VTAFFSGLLIFFILSGVFVYWGSGGPQSPKEFTGEVISFSASTDSFADTDKFSQLRVLSWNIGYGYGMGSAGEGYATKSRAHFERELLKMVKLFDEYKIDVALIQEIDQDSGRSGHLDQVKYLAENSNLRFAAYAPSWKANYVPFPYWPPTNHFGKVYSGGAVLSRFPILENRINLWSKPSSFSYIYNFFYLFRYTQNVLLQLPNGREYSFVNSHLEAFDDVHRDRQGKWMAERVDRYLSEGSPVLAIGGDFNVDSQSRSAQALMALFPGFRDTFAGSNLLSFPADKPDRRIDYILVKKENSVQSRKIPQVGEISDHLPLILEVDLN